MSESCSRSSAFPTSAQDPPPRARRTDRRAFKKTSPRLGRPSRRVAGDDAGRNPVSGRSPHRPEERPRAARGQARNPASPSLRVCHSSPIDGMARRRFNGKVVHVDSARVLVRNLLLNCDQRDINFADHAAPLELHSRRARELLREAFFDQKHPEASTRRLSSGGPPFSLHLK